MSQPSRSSSAGDRSARTSPDPQRPQAADPAHRARLLEQLVTSITDFAYIFDLQGRFAFVNKPLLDLWGLTLDQAVGKDFFDLKYPPELAATLQRQIQEVIETGRRLVDETPYTSPSGLPGYYQYIFSPVLAADGSVEAVAGSTRDISNQKAMEADQARLTRAVDAERRKLANVIEQAPAFICVLAGPRHTFELVNEMYYQLVDRRDIVGKSIREALPELAGQGFFELLDEVYQTGRPFTGSEAAVRLRRHNGSDETRFVNFVYQAMRDADGRTTGIFVHGVDVTDMVRSREALREREERLRTSDERLTFALDAAEMGTFYCPMPLREIVWNSKCKEHFWLPPEAHVDIDRFYAILHPDDRQRARKAIDATLYHRQPYDVQYRTVATDGRVRWIRAVGRAYHDEQGNPTRFDGITLDVTEQQQIDQALRESEARSRAMAAERAALLDRERIARAEAETASAAKDRFLAVLSHELRTPLSPVAMVIPAIEADAEMPERFRDDLAMVRRNIDLEVKLIDDLLDLSRVASGKLELHLQEVHVHELLRHALHNSVSDSPGKRLDIRQALDAHDDRLTADPARLQQVFWNLLRNAVKFTPDNGQITVRTWNAPDQRHLLVEIRDSGVGIPPETLPRIFDSFEQGDARMTRQFGGLGLGLAIAKAVVEMHGGQIHAASEGRDQGTTLTVELNLAATATTAPKALDAVANASEIARRNARILLVEDHVDTARTMARLLRSSGFDITVAHTVESALDLANQRTFDVVVSDIGLPDASGYDLMTQLQARQPIIGIALSGYGMEDDVRKSREAGFAEHLTKPVSPSQLEAALERLTEAK